MGTQDIATATAALAADGVTLPAKSLFLDISALVNGLDPTGAFFGHGKRRKFCRSPVRRTTAIT